MKAIVRQPLLRSGALLLALLLHALLASAAGAQETVCLQCHSNQPGPLGSAVAHWQGSIHAANGISCHDCHGGDPHDFAMAMSPERGFLGVPTDTGIPDFCGRCHIGVREDYLASAHGAALGKGGPQCVTCHGSHLISSASIELINPQDCSRCHEYARAEQIRTALLGTEQLMTGIASDLQQFSRLGLRTREKQDELFAVRNDFRRLAHSVDVDRVQTETRAFRERLQGIEETVAQIKQQLNQRKIWGGVAVLALVLAGIVALLVRKTYAEEENDAGN